jgi:hypothetical protein
MDGPRDDGMHVKREGMFNTPRKQTLKVGRVKHCQDNFTTCFLKFF